MIQTSFKRYEKKYILQGGQYQEVRMRIEPYMAVDEYGLSTICNVYYDTPSHDLIIRSLEKPEYKEKLRLRSYGVPERDGLVFLEIKKKADGVVYKRRLPMSLGDAEKSLRDRCITGEQAGSQIARELDYFLQRYELIPATYLAYDRIAMLGRENAGIRITFDQNIRSRQQQMNLAAGDRGGLVLPEDQVIMEIKADDAYPFWLVKILEDLKIFPGSFSKYGTVYQKQIFAKVNKKRKGNAA